MEDGSYKYSNEESDAFSYTSASSLSTFAPFEKMYDYFEEQIAPIKNKVVGVTSKALSREDIGTIASKSLYHYANDTYPQYSVIASIINSGGVRQTIPAGEVSYGQIYAALPFDNTNNVCSITGADLKRLYLDNDSYYYSYCDEDSFSIKDNEQYNVITLSYISDGKYGRSFTVLERDGNYLRNIVADYFMEAMGNA